jgi:CRP/FNR family transcriptional regulator, cyclic AMP receptor protein
MDVERLRKIPLFGELDHYDLSVLARWVSEIEVREGDLIIEQGAIPHDLFVIEEGTAEVTRDGVPVATLGPGEVLGEMGLLRLQRRAATVRAITHLRALSLDADHLAAMSEEMPEVAERLREIMARREHE